MTAKTSRRAYGDTGLTASITVFEGRIELGTRGLMTREWQTLAWEYWGRLGEFMDPTEQQSNLITRLKWRVVVDGQELQRDDESEEPDEVDGYLAQVTEGLGPAQAIKLLTLNVQVPGECWYVYRGPVNLEAPEGVRRRQGWNCYAITEPRLRELLEQRGDGFLNLRVKVDDPRDQDFAISRFSAAIDPGEELLVLRAVSRAQGRSRLAQAGILFRPSEAQFPLKDPDDPSKGDTFGDDLELAMTAPIADERSPSALVPLDIEVKGDLIEKFKHMAFERPLDEKLPEKIDAAIEAIAIALDIPADLLKGITDANHWTAWLLQEDNYRAHVEPLAVFVGEVLAKAGVKLGIGEVIEVTPDPSRLLAKRSTVADAFAAARTGAVGLAYVREAIGASDEDAPTVEEMKIMLAFQRGGQSLIGEILGIDIASPEAVPVDTSGEEDDDLPVDDPARRGPPEDGPPDESPDDVPSDTRGKPVRRTTRRKEATPKPRFASGNGLNRRLLDALTAASVDPATATNEQLDRFGRDLAQFDLDLVHELLGAMAMQIDAARSRVGAKIVTAVRTTTPGLRAKIQDVPNSDVAAKLGLDTAYRLIDLPGTIASSLEPLGDWWDRRLRDARKSLAKLAGIDTSVARWAEQGQRSRAELLADLARWVEAYVAHSDAELPKTPTEIARNAVAVAGGSQSEPVDVPARVG